MIILITAIMPEAKAVLSACPMKRVLQDTITVYQSEDGLFRLLVTGSGKLNAAVAVTEYLSLYPASDTDIFCNLGICGGTGLANLHTGYLCPPSRISLHGRPCIRKYSLIRSRKPTCILQTLRLPQENYRKLPTEICLFYMIWKLTALHFPYFER